MDRGIPECVAVPVARAEARAGRQGTGRRWMPALGLCVLAGVVLFESIPVTRLPAPALDFDIQVVLGGNEHDRSAAAHALWRQRRTPILVTGDQGAICAELVALGVPASNIIHERYATSTWENMEFSVPILREFGVRRALVVSSWFHMTRVQGCFGTLEGDIEFDYHSDPIPSRFGREEWKLLAKERCKSLYYAVVRGVSPWASGG
jgi:uncharacterized SAM-binding protein YcdF (DUF218 family)